MKELYKKNDITITLLNDNYYMIEAPCATLKGFYQKINKYQCKMRLDYWKDGKTNRLKSNKNKMFDHTCRWFVYILQKYLEI